MANMRKISSKNQRKKARSVGAGNVNGAGQRTPLRVIFASSEVQPLIKTGGLADVSGSLPVALRELGDDVRVLMPAYPSAVAGLDRLERVSELRVTGCAQPVGLLHGNLAHSDTPVYLMDAPWLFDRTGAPYTGPDGHDWHDNAERFAAFCRVIAAVAQNHAGLDWQPDVVHCNDWQTGLAPAFLTLHEHRPATVFTIHNLAYQGVFSRAVYQQLDLPPEWWSMHALEFYGNFSFIKGGLAFADWLTTVSPSYAREIRSSALGYGLQGLLQARSDHLLGILNGANYEEWDPAVDTFLETRYGPENLHGKALAKRNLQAELGLPERPDTPLLGYVGRMVEQKGIDLIVAMLPWLAERDVQVVALGSGEPHYESALKAAAQTHPDKVGVHIGFSEALAHGITAGADALMMPSRFEPCGLNQIYSLRYGTVPIVRRTGGLADTVVHAVPRTLDNGTATGFVFDEPTTESLIQAVRASLGCYRQMPDSWRKLMQSGMAQDFGWTYSAREYQSMYDRAAKVARAQSPTPTE